MPKVMASVMGMEIAINTAERHSQKPINETSTTRMMASYKRVHEQADVLLDLQRLVGGAGDDQILRQVLPDRRQLLIDALAEGVDLLAILHLDRYGHGAAAMPAAVRGQPGEVVQVARRALVAAGDIDQVAKIDRTVCGGGGGSDNDIADLLLILKFPGWIDQNVLRTDFELSRRAGWCCELPEYSSGRRA